MKQDIFPFIWFSNCPFMSHLIVSFEALASVLSVTKHLFIHTSSTFLSSLPPCKPSEYRPNIEVYFLLSSLTFPIESMQNILFFLCNTLYLLFLYHFPNFLFSKFSSVEATQKSHGLYILEQ